MCDKPARILVIDDTPENLDVLSALLDQHHFAVLFAVDGKSGIQCAESGQPDLILLDIMMPGMDGFETCRQLKAKNKTKEIPVIFMTALSTTEEKVKGFACGAVDYIIKPFQSEEVLARVATHLRIQNLTRNLQHTNRELSQTLDDLKATQKQLIESEKMAALGRLVAGVAHEINTPVGIGITASSLLESKTTSLLEAIESGNMTRSQFQNYLTIVMESNQLILHNLQRVADLVQKFKQVAVDDNYLESRTFPVKSYIEDTVLMIPKAKRSQHTLNVNGDESITISCHPGTFFHVITNLVLNSITHGYQADQHGNLCFDLRQEQDRLIIEYTDDGCGIPAEHLDKVFDPFFTTARNKGRPGLGLHIVYNMVTQILKGTILCESQVGSGTKFILNLPLKL